VYRSRTDDGTFQGVDQIALRSGDELDLRQRQLGKHSEVEVTHVEDQQASGLQDGLNRLPEALIVGLGIGFVPQVRR
jgi:uncharacterized NAD(P)/FAD-binding protein YdhS